MTGYFEDTNPLPYPNQAYFAIGLQIPRGGGGTSPLSKSPVPLLKIDSSVFFLKTCPKMSLLTPLSLPWKPWLAFKVAIRFQFLTGNPYSKMENFFPLVESSQSNFL